MASGSEKSRGSRIKNTTSAKERRAKRQAEYQARMRRLAEESPF